MPSRSILKTITKWQGSKRRLCLKCAGVGLASGLVVVAYRLALGGSQELLPRPRLEILPGDSLAVLASEQRAAQVKPVLLAMGAPAEVEIQGLPSSKVDRSGRED